MTNEQKTKLAELASRVVQKAKAVTLAKSAFYQLDVA
jgi:hypothetical protein